MTSMFGESMRSIRETLGWSQEKLAVKAEISAAAISHFETGKRLPSFENLVRLADAFDVSIDRLIGRNHE
jgi:transcriptional regulator with XRE-family HTH domain